MVDVPQMIAEATQARARLLDGIRVLSSATGAFKPDPAEWSIAENVEHLVLAEQGAVNRVWAAADGLRRGQQARDIATPRRCGPLAYWILAMECNQPLLDAVPAALAELDPAEVVTPHPISCPWDAGQWLAFVRFHLDLHRQ
jgi:DinB superfamily